MPDVYLIPKIASFFGITIDQLYGVSNIENATLLVDKYGVMKQEQLYFEANDALSTLLVSNPDDVDSLYQLAKLEFIRANAIIEKNMEISERVLELSPETSTLHKFSEVALMKKSAALGDFSFVDEMRLKFQQEKNAKTFNNYVLALLSKHQYHKILALSERYFNSFSDKDQYLIAPNLMETAFLLDDMKATRFYFDVICQSADGPQIFSAWWIMWKIYKKHNLNLEANQCIKRIKDLLPEQGYSDYRMKRLEELLYD